MKAATLTQIMIANALTAATIIAALAADLLLTVWVFYELLSCRTCKAEDTLYIDSDLTIK